MGTLSLQLHIGHWKKPYCWKRLKAGGEGDNRKMRWLMASLTQWTLVWASSERWWRTGKPGVLQSLGSQRVRQDLAFKLNWTEDEDSDSFPEGPLKSGERTWEAPETISGSQVGSQEMMAVTTTAFQETGESESASKRRARLRRPLWSLNHQGGLPHLLTLQSIQVLEDKATDDSTMPSGLSSVCRWTFFKCIWKWEDAHIWWRTW